MIPENNERGTILILSLMVLALLTILSMAAVMTTSTDLKISGNFRRMQDALYNTEGSMDIIPGVVRRTIAIQTETPSILTTLGITDTDGDGISDTEENGSVFSAGLNATDCDTTGTADFSEAIMGFASTDASCTAWPPPFTITPDPTNAPTETISVTASRVGPKALKGFSTGFATGYEGGAISGQSVSFNIVGTGQDSHNTSTQVTIRYRCVERKGGGCW